MAPASAAAPVSRDEAAPCAAAVAAAQVARTAHKAEAQAKWRARWPDVENPTDYLVLGPGYPEGNDDPYPYTAPPGDYYAQVRASCSERILPVALAAEGIQTFGLNDACQYDPYRESALCATVPQATLN